VVDCGVTVLGREWTIFEAYDEDINILEKTFERIKQSAQQTVTTLTCRDF
jgi:hypothetical protein